MEEPKFTFRDYLFLFFFVLGAISLLVFVWCLLMLKPIGAYALLLFGFCFGLCMGISLTREQLNKWGKMS